MKKLLSLILALTLFVSCTSFAAPDINQSTQRADALAALGLFQGNEYGYDLGSYATRVQIAVTLTRLLGKESKAHNQNNPHPFYDVPNWASPYIGWLYENYMINGLDDYTFGTNVVAEPKQFIAMVLRALGYSDKNGKDFYYENAVEFAAKVGLISSSDIIVYKQPQLTRKMMVDLEYQALITPIKNSRRTLAKKLCEEGVIIAAVAESAGISVRGNPGAIFADIPQVYGVLTACRNNYNEIKFNVSEPIEEYAIRMYCSVDNAPYTEVPRDYASGMYFTYGPLSWWGPAGYVSEFTAHNVPNDGKTYKFILLKTSSTGVIYNIFGKTTEVEVR